MFVRCLKTLVTSSRLSSPTTGSVNVAGSIRAKIGKATLPQVLHSRTYDKLRLLVVNFLHDKSEATKFRALSTLNGIVMKVEDPGEIKLLSEVYTTLQAESMMPAKAKETVIAGEENETLKFIESSILSLSSLHDRFEKERSSIAPKTLKEITKHTEDPMYELAQYVSSISVVAFTTLLTKFTSIADSYCFESRALSILLKEIKKRVVKDGGQGYIWMHVIRVLMLSKDFDLAFLIKGSGKVKACVHKLDFLSCLRTFEYALSCTGFEDFDLFVSFFKRLKETLADSPSNCLHRVYQVITMTGIYHVPLVHHLNQRYRLAFNNYSLEANVMVLDCLLSSPSSFSPRVLGIEEKNFHKGSIKDPQLIIRLMDIILLSIETLPVSDAMKIRQAKRLCWCLEQPEVLHLDIRKDLIHKLSQTILVWLVAHRTNPLIDNLLIQRVSDLVWKNRQLFV